MFNTQMFGEGLKFSDPFLVPSLTKLPKDLKSAMDFCLFLYYRNPQYVQASRRVFSHFMTDIDFVGKSGDMSEKNDFKDFLMDHMRMFDAMSIMGAEWSCYGNSFWRMYYPFDRFLVDLRKGYNEYALDLFRAGNMTFDLQSLTYTIPDPLNQGRTVSLPFVDKPASDPTRLRLCPVNPRNIIILHAYASGKCSYIYRFEEDYKSDVKRGELHQVNETSVEMLKALRDNMDFQFFDGELFHFKEPTISGISNGGWGLPNTLANYSSLHQLQVYRQIDESVGRSYMLPFRVFSPEPTNTSSDISQHTSMGEWAARMQAMIKDHRQNPERIHAFPFPISYQEHGLSGKMLTPKDLIEYQTNDMLDGMGYPSELFRGSLQLQSIPTALRIFENSFWFMYAGYDRFLKWVANKVADYRLHERMGVTMRLPSIADDLEERGVYLQLAAGGEISREKAYRHFNIKDPVEEAKRRMQEDIEIQKAQQTAQEDYERELSSGSVDHIMAAQAQGGMPGPAAPLPASMLTPTDIMAQAEQEAQRLLSIPEQGMRNRELRMMQASNPNLHAAVKQKMEEIRSYGASQGRQQMVQSLQGG